MSAPGQPRTADGRFASVECPGTYRRLVEALTEPAEADRWTDPENPFRTIIRTEKCPHGSFVQYARRNCCRPAGTPAPRRR